MTENKSFDEKKVLLKSKVKASISHKLEKLFNNNFILLIVAVWVMLTHCLALDVIGMGGMVLFFMLVCVFCSDFRPALIPIVLTVMVVSNQNSPGYSLKAEYYNSFPVVMFMWIAASLVVISIVFHITYYRKWKNLLIKSNVALSVTVYSVAMLLGGLFVAINKAENLGFAIGMVASLMLVYVLARALVQKRPDNLMFLAKLCATAAVIIALQIGWVYMLEYKGSPFNASWIMKVVVGWSVQNAISEMIVMLLPAFFYLMYFDSKRVILYFAAALLCMVAVLFSFCRASLIFGSLVFVGLTVLLMIKGNGRKAVRYMLLIMVLAVIIVGLVLHFTGNLAFWENVLSMWLKGNKFDFSDNGRFILWEKSIEYFKAQPIFGKGFLAYFYEIGKGTNAFVYLFHNTVLQMLGSCGIVGLVAYGYHCLSTGWMFIRKPNMGRSFFGVSLLACMLMALVDTIMFLPYVLFFYAIILAFAEKDYIEKKL